MINELIALLTFFVFTVLQALVINGIKGSMEEGMILNGFLKWTQYHFGPFWSKPVSGCIKCMSSFYGALTYWPVVLWWFGFEWWQLFLFKFDVFILVYLNFFFYKRQ